MKCPHINRKSACKKETSKVTRVEVIDENGRAYVRGPEDIKVELSFQDEDRTLKIFIKKLKEEKPI